MEGGSNAIGARLALGEERALEDAYEVFGPSLLLYLRRHVGPNDCEDVLQRTFLEAWRSAKRYDSSRRFESWLFTIAHRRAVDCLRQRHGSVVDVESLRHLVGEDGRETLERHADAAEVRAAVHGLPAHERDVLELAYFGGLTQTEIAARLQVPLGTVKARAARGTRSLAALLREQREERVRDDRTV